MSGTNLNHSSDVGSPFSQFGINGTLGASSSAGSESKKMTSMDHTKKTLVPSESGPIIVGNCTRCNGMVRISHSLSVNTIVRCPHCQESFVLSELLDQSLPPVEVVVDEPEFEQEDAPYIDTLHLKRDEQASRPEKPRVKFEIPKALKDGAKRKRRRRRRSRSSSQGESSNSSSGKNSYVIPSSTPVDGDSTTVGEAVERRRSRQSERQSNSSQSGERASYRGKVRSHASRLQEANSVWSGEDLFKIAAGILLAFPVGYMMLIWIFRADPIGVANPISRLAPFAIPSSMHAVVEPQVAPETPSFPVPSYLKEENQVKPFVPKPINDDDDRIAIPDIDPDEVFGEEFDL